MGNYKLVPHHCAMQICNIGSFLGAASRQAITWANIADGHIRNSQFRKVPWPF